MSIRVSPSTVKVRKSWSSGTKTRRSGTVDTYSPPFMSWWTSRAPFQAEDRKASVPKFSLKEKEETSSLVLFLMVKS